MISVLGISGSLRAGSFNTALLRACSELTPDGMSLEITDAVRAIPLFDGDLFAAGFPEPVVALRAAIARADALLIATPEYNYSVPGGLKNALDWCSRGPDQPFAGKPAAILGASPGMSGTMRAQTHLRDIAVFLDLRLLNRPEVILPRCADRFEGGVLKDVPTRQLLADLLVALRDHVGQLRADRTPRTP